MALPVTAPISTAVIEANPDCRIRGTYENGVLRITIDIRACYVQNSPEAYLTSPLAGSVIVSALLRLLAGSVLLAQKEQS